jgi:hypothetical protein
MCGLEKGSDHSLSVSPSRLPQPPTIWLLLKAFLLASHSTFRIHIFEYFPGQAAHNCAHFAGDLPAPLQYATLVGVLCVGDGTNLLFVGLLGASLFEKYQELPSTTSFST